MVDLTVSLAGVELKNPVIPASGTFGYGREYAELYDLNILGSFSWKGTTGSARLGNSQPRIAETEGGMLNAVGLQNPGIDAVIANEVPNIVTLFQGPVIANVGGFSLEEYADNCRKLNDVDQVKILEVNISCPNVTDIAAIAKACEAEGADGICLINTLLGMRIDLKTRRPLLANRTGGLSGPAVFPVAVRMVWDVYEAVKVPIIGCGGVSSAEDVCEMMLSGASAVEIGAANLRDPYACKTIIEKLPAVCEQLGVTKISELTGGAHHG